MENKVLKVIDFFFNKLLPKKFIVVTVATIIIMKKLEVPPQYWELLKFYMIGGTIITTGKVITDNIRKGD